MILPEQEIWIAATIAMAAAATTLGDWPAFTNATDLCFHAFEWVWDAR